jgi:hypothetical protein
MGLGPEKIEENQGLGPKNFRCVWKKLALFHMEEAFFSLKHKPGYLEHMNSDFGSEKCVAKLRMRDTPWTYNLSKKIFF